MFLRHRWERDPDDYGAYPLFRCTRCGKRQEFPAEKALEQPRGVRGLVDNLAQILVSAVAIAAIGGLIGFLVVGHGTRGFGVGMTVAGALIAVVTGASGSPSENLQRGRLGAALNYWGESAPLPQSPLQIALGGALAFGAGIALVLAY